MTSMTPPTAYQPGTTLTVGSHNVVIKKYLSQGGFAHVYVCEISPPWNNTTIACLKRVAVADKPTLNILRQEVDAMRRLEGKSYIVSYIDSHASRLNTNAHDPNGKSIVQNSHGYEVFLLMEYCSKNSLIDFMNTRLVNKLTEVEILQIMGEITEGVAHMHALNPPLIHKDIKIENVLISADNHYKLCDFGSASPPLRPPKNVEEFQVLQDDIMKHTTPQYRCPEMIDLYRRLPINEKSDIWALGVFLYKLCYYTTPFENNSINGNGNAGGGEYAILNGIFSFPPQPVYSTRLKNVISKCLAVNPDARPNVFQLLMEICKMRNVPYPSTVVQQAKQPSPPTNALPNNNFNSAPSTTAGPMYKVSSQSSQVEENRPSLPIRKNKIGTDYPLTKTKSEGLEKFTNQPNFYMNPSSAKTDPFAGIEKSAAVFHHNKSSNDITSIPNNLYSSSSSSSYANNVNNNKFAESSKFIPPRNNPPYRIHSPNMVPTSEMMKTNANNLINSNKYNARPISMSAADFNNLQPINTQSSGSNRQNIMSAIHKQETVKLSPNNSSKKTFDALTGGEFKQPQRTGERGRKERVRSSGAHSKRSSISSLKDLLTGNRTGNKSREPSRGPPPVRNYTGSNSRHPSANFNLMNSSTESLNEIHRISSIESNGSIASSIINGYASYDSNGSTNNKTRDFSNERLQPSFSSSTQTEESSLNPKLPPSRPPKRSNSIQRRVQMLLNRKQSPPPPKTAAGYGKYTAQQLQQQQQQQQQQQHQQSASPVSASPSPSPSLSHNQDDSSDDDDDEIHDKRVPALPRRSIHHHQHRYTSSIDSSATKTPPPPVRRSQKSFPPTSPTLSTISSASVSTTTTTSNSNPYSTSSPMKLNMEGSIKTIVANKKPPPPRPKKPAFLKSPSSVNKNKLSVPTKTGTSVNSDEDDSSNSFSSPNRNRRRLSGMSDFDDIEDLEKRFNEKFPSAL